MFGQDRDYQRRLAILYNPCTPNNFTNTCMSSNFTALVEYLKAPSFIMLSNNQRFDSSIYSGDPIIKESVFTQTLFDPTRTGIVEGNIRDFKVDDSVSYLHFFQDRAYSGWSFT